MSHWPSFPWSTWETYASCPCSCILCIYAEILVFIRSLFHHWYGMDPFLNVMICFPRGQKSRRRVSILAGAIVSDYQDRVGNRESLLDAQANLLDHFFFLACQVLRVNYRCNNQRQRKTLTSSSDYSNRRLYITSSCKPPRTLKTLAEMKGCTD